MRSRRKGGTTAPALNMGLCPRSPDSSDNMRAKLAGWQALRPRPSGLCTIAAASYTVHMRIQSSALDPSVETIAELRELYRAAEARAARLRLLSSSGRDLAAADADSVNGVLQHCATRLAYFAGRTQAHVSLGPDATGISIAAPGGNQQIVGRLNIPGLTSADDVPDKEDQDAFRMHIELMGAAIDRINREQERVQLLSTLMEREQRLEYLVSRIFSAQEEERRRVSHDLHDGVAQTATALARMLEGANSIPEADIPAADRARLATIARDLVTELRGVIGGLRPTMLDDLGLEAALRALMDSLKTEGYDVEISIPATGAKWPPNVETALFRVAQEAVANIRKHSGGICRVQMELHVSENVGSCFLRIRDFGQGCSEEVAKDQAGGAGTHVGIDVMRERMAAVGGKIDWTSKSVGGVEVVASFTTKV